MLAILTSKLGLAGIALALVLAVFGIQALRLQHAKSELVSIKAAQLAAKADVATHEATAAAISSRSALDLGSSKAGIVTRYRTLVQRVPVDVPEGADRDCVVSAPFIHLWNLGVSPDAPRSGG